jgi:cytochrome c oxidase assembly protein subunit 15
MEKWLKRLAVATTIGMFIVLIMGATVTNTGSGEGCGRSWPLCHGELVPEYAFTTAVEYSHRMVTGIEGFLIAGTVILAFRSRRRQREVMAYSAGMIGTLFLQSGLGAAAVLWPQSPYVMAGHFGVSLVCFACSFLLMRLLFETNPDGTIRSRAVVTSDLSPWFRRGTWLALFFSIAVAYIGAYMRHSNAMLACATWPDCNGKVYPGFDGPVGVAFGHRIAASAEMILITLLFWASYRRREAEPALFRVNLGAFAFVMLQALSGGAVVLTKFDTWSPLAHAALMALLFICLAEACRQIFPRAQQVTRPHVSLAPAATATQ